MRLILSSAEMQAADKNTIENHHMPAAVLMERAAAACVFEIEEHFDRSVKVGILCGPGNNGGDGVAIARLLHLDGYSVKVLLLGDGSRRSADLVSQIEAAESYEVPFVGDTADLDDCGLLIDAMFGVGLRREVTGDFAGAISYVNQRHAEKKAAVLAVDIPSGISSDSGQILGTAVDADITVTFAYKKKGHCQGEGYLKSGRIYVADVGIYLDGKQKNETGSVGFEIEDTDAALVPARDKGANKGAAKVLVIAGSSDIYGACYLSAKAACRAGAGYVKVYTHNANLPVLREKLPEAVCAGYDEPDENEIKRLISWADAVLIGPGISMSARARELVRILFEACDRPMVVDADAVNIIAEGAADTLKTAKAPVIVTPHLLEMSRLTGKSVDELQGDMSVAAEDFSRENGCTVLLKSYTSVIAGSMPSENGGSTKRTMFFNTSGSEALATAGSGDVLAGITAAFLAMGAEPVLAAALAAYVHGKAGVEAAARTANGVIMASDIIDVM